MTLSDGSLYGTFCAFGLTSDKQLTRRDKALIEVLASTASVIIEPTVHEERRRAEIETRLRPVIADGGPLVVLQPIVDLATGGRFGTEALSRFPADWGKAPYVCFAEAHSAELGHRLELLALVRAAHYLHRVDGYVSMNVSPATLLIRACAKVLARMPLDRMLLELSEHDRVEDYATLVATLAPFRPDGLRRAIDDVGTGSPRSGTSWSPRWTCTGSTTASSGDSTPTPPWRSSRTPWSSSATAATSRSSPKGIETAAEAAALLSLGVDYGQGWHFGRPGTSEALSEITGPAAAILDPFWAAAEAASH